MKMADIKAGMTLYGVAMDFKGWSHRDPELVAVRIVRELPTRFEVHGDRLIMLMNTVGTSSTKGHLYKHAAGGERLAARLFPTPAEAWDYAVEAARQRINEVEANLKQAQDKLRYAQATREALFTRNKEVPS